MSAYRELDDSGKMGFEVILLRHVPAKIAKRVTTVFKPVGWRFYPDAGGRKSYYA